jgi:hypothetical protein
LVDFAFGVEIQDYSEVILQVNRPAAIHYGNIDYKQGAMRSDNFLYFQTSVAVLAKASILS